MVLRIVRVLVLALALASCGDKETPGLKAAVAASVSSPVVDHDPALFTPVLPEVDLQPAVIREFVQPASCLSERGTDLVISFEVGSPEVYTRKYIRPIWPGAASGVTVGIGYDLGHRGSEVILLDWERHPHRVRLATASGYIGEVARPLARQLADISVEYGYARQVFDQTSVVEHCRIAQRVFGKPFLTASQGVRDALGSIVFNRGGSMSGAGRREMRTIRDVCLPARDRHCVAAEIRAMKRIWKGSTIEAGMRRRREAEAKLAESA